MSSSLGSELGYQNNHSSRGIRRKPIFASHSSNLDLYQNEELGGTKGFTTSFLCSLMFWWKACQWTWQYCSPEYFHLSPKWASTLCDTSKRSCEPPLSLHGNGLVVVDLAFHHPWNRALEHVQFWGWGSCWLYFVRLLSFALNNLKKPHKPRNDREKSILRRFYVVLSTRRSSDICRLFYAMSEA